MTQTEKITRFCKCNTWTCQATFWKNFIFSPHKRRSDIVEEGEYYFEERPCEHGISHSKDFKRIKVKKA